MREMFGDWVIETAPEGTEFEIKGAWECPDCEGFCTGYWLPIPDYEGICPRCNGQGALWDNGWYEKSCCFKGECDIDDD